MIELLHQHRQQIAALCLQFGVERLESFGSAARGEFDPASSDLDFLVQFKDLGWKDPSVQYFGLLHALEDLLGRRIDLVERAAVENRYFLEVAERHRDLLYAA